MSIQDHIVLITASSGIGAAIARVFAQAVLILVARRQERLEQQMN